ncbi:MAG: SPOR domain-containing protein, partial [Pseudomonadota bacterium]
MAEAEFGTYGAETQTSYTLGAGNFIHILGGVVSLALIAGICVWGYQLLARDVSGVPVVQALDGPMRTAPEDPGGHPAAHQGLAVNEVAAVGVASAPRDRLVLAPPAIDLATDDAPLTLAAPGAEAVTTGPEVEGDIAMTTLPDADETDITALLESLADGAEPLGELAPLEESADDVAT